MDETCTCTCQICGTSLPQDEAKERKWLGAGFCRGCFVEHLTLKPVTCDNEDYLELRVTTGHEQYLPAHLLGRIKGEREP